MKPRFTIHEGEYLVGDLLEREHRLNIWVPGKDTGIDLLVSGETPQRCVGIQVKFSKDHNLVSEKANLRSTMLCVGWWTLNLKKIDDSKANYWVFVIPTYSRIPDAISENEKNAPAQFIVVPQKELSSRLKQIHGETNKPIQCYMAVSKSGKFCAETRGLKDSAIMKCMAGEFSEQPSRDFSAYLKNWTPILDDLGVPGREQVLQKLRNFGGADA